VQDSPGGMNHFPSPGVPAGADGNTGNLLAEDFGGGGLQEALQRLRGSMQVRIKGYLKLSTSPANPDTCVCLAQWQEACMSRKELTMRTCCVTKPYYSVCSPTGASEPSGRSGEAHASTAAE
jgi:hypothetical protein